MGGEAQLALLFGEKAGTDDLHVGRDRAYRGSREVGALAPGG